MKIKNKIFLIFLLIIIFIIIATIAYRKINYKYIKQLNLDTSTELNIYKFKEGTGFIDNKASNSQKKAIWNLINNMVLIEKITLNDGNQTFGVHPSFYFKKDNIKTVFYLRKLSNEKLYIIVDEYDNVGNIANTFYYTSNIQFAEKIKNVIISDP